LEPLAFVPPGLYALIVKADGVRVGLHLMTVEYPEVHLSLLSSAFAPNFQFGNRANQQQPSILVSYGGEPFYGARVYVQLLYAPEGSPVHVVGKVQDSSPESVEAGVYLRLDATHGPFWPYEETNGSGVAEFKDLVIPYVKFGLNISLRYCVASDIGALERSTYCVQDTGFAIYRGSSVRFFSSVQSLAGTSGVVMGSVVSITAVTGSDGSAFSSAVALMRCTAYASRRSTPSVPLDGLLIFYEPTLTREHPLTERIFIALGDTMSFRFGVVNSAADGLYSVHLVCAGGRVTLPLAVASNAIEAAFVSTPNASSLEVGKVTRVSVKVLTPGGGPLPNVIVSLQIVLPCRHICEGALIPCGTITGETISKTDEFGFATLSYAFEQAPSATFFLEAVVLKLSDNAFVTSSFASGIAELEALAGITAAQIANEPEIMLTVDQRAILLAASYSARLSLPTLSNDCDNSSGGGSEDQLQLFTQFAGATPAVRVASQSVVVHAINKVAKILVVQNMRMEMTLPQSIQGFSATRASLFLSGEAVVPILTFLDARGLPVENASVEIAFRGAGNTSLHYPSTLASNRSGVCVVSPLELYADEAGEFQLIFSSRGGGVAAVPVVVRQPPILSQDDAMQIAAYLLFILCAPFFVFLVPYSRSVTALCTTLIVVSTAALIFFLGKGEQILTAITGAQLNQYAAAFIIFALAIAGTVVAGFLVLVAMKIFPAWLPMMPRIADDELSAKRRFAYVKWLVNVRVAHQLDADPPRSSDSDDQSDDVEMTPREQEADSRAFHSTEEHISSLEAESDSRMRTGRMMTVLRKNKTLLYDAAIEPIETPVSVWAALGVAALFCVVSILILLYVRDRLFLSLRSLMMYFPSTEDLTAQARDSARVLKDLDGTPIGTLLGAISSEDGVRAASNNIGSVAQKQSKSLGLTLTRINDVVVAVLRQLLMFLGKEFPQFSGIASLMVQIESVNLFDKLGAVHNVLLSVLSAVHLSFAVAISLSTVLVAFVGCSVVVAARGVARDIRRGTFDFGSEPPSALSVNSYIPLHAFHFFAVHQVAFWLFFIVVMLFTWSAVRETTYALLLEVALPAILSGTLVDLLQNFILHRYFLARDELTVIRPELFSFWTLYGILSSSISAVGGTLSRLGLVFLTSIGCFVRLDFSIFAKPFAFLDDAHQHFVSVIAIEVRASNPIMLYFSAVLLTGLRARARSAHLQAFCKLPDLSIPALLQDGEKGLRSTLSGALINVAMLYADDVVSEHGGGQAGSRMVEYYGVDRSRWARRNWAVNKFWIALLLTNNPSLRRLRKGLNHD
jgi:hypothetical protein